MFRLNLPAIHLVNGVYPLQFALLIPFYRLGAWIFGANVLAISLDGARMILFGVGQAICHDVCIGCVTGGRRFVGGLLCVALVPEMRRLKRNFHPNYE